MKVVLDTNVLVSALLKGDGVPARIVRAVWDGNLELLLSAGLLEELGAVLGIQRSANASWRSRSIRRYFPSSCPSLVPL
jgi:putative PIN family toxin of toxin-antitoxin system